MINIMRQDDPLGHALVIDEAIKRGNQRYLVIRDSYESSHESSVEAYEVPYEFVRLLLNGECYTISERKKEGENS